MTSPPIILRKDEFSNYHHNWYTSEQLEMITKFFEDHTVVELPTTLMVIGDFSQEILDSKDVRELLELNSSNCRYIESVDFFSSPQLISAVRKIGIVKASGFDHKRVVFKCFPTEFKDAISINMAEYEIECNISNALMKLPKLNLTVDKLMVKLNRLAFFGEMFNYMTQHQFDNNGEVMRQRWKFFTNYDNEDGINDWCEETETI